VAKRLEGVEVLANDPAHEAEDEDEHADQPDHEEVIRDAAAQRAFPLRIPC